MKKMFVGASLLCAMQLALTVNAMDHPRIIVRADDMGSSRASNIACLKSQQEGIVTSIEVMAVCSWFPEAVRILKQNPQIDVGLHLTLTSEWDNVKWRPISKSPSLVDANGYFFPKINPSADYPGQSLSEHPWSLTEIEQEFRAQIEVALRNIPQLTHLSGHMGSTFFNEEVSQLAQRLSAEYQLPLEFDIPGLKRTSYKGAHGTFAEKETSFIEMLNSLEAGKDYLFLDHPALDTEEMQGVGHIGYEKVAADRQGVTDLFTSEKVKKTITDKGIELVTYNQLTKALPRSTPEAENVSPDMLENYLAAIKKDQQNIHSVMVLRHGKVVAEKWLGDGAPGKNHVMFSVSKTYTATAVGFAVQEGLLKVTDKVVSFFPNDLPKEVSPGLAQMEIRHLLTMSVGHEKELPWDWHEKEGINWAQEFLKEPVAHEPGTVFHYNSMATYMLSAIVQKVTGQKVIDYLYPRLFRPLGIAGVRWEESPQGINCGGWGLWAKTEDMAKLGQFFLQKGQWNGKQLLSQAWFEEATTKKIEQQPGASQEKLASSDWVQGYCYQMWRCRHNAFRADGAGGQFIVILPEKDAVVAITAELGDMQNELNFVWDYILPGLK